jgi:hypothetical protein
LRRMEVDRLMVTPKVSAFLAPLISTMRKRLILLMVSFSLN